MSILSMFWTLNSVLKKFSKIISLNIKKCYYVNMNDGLKKTRVTIYEVAKHAGVSLATVSRVINDAPSVSQATKDKVRNVIKKLGYKPSILAQGLATSRSLTIGVVIPSSNYVYISNFLNGVQEEAKELGLKILIFTTFHSRNDAYKVIEEVIKAHVDGIVIFDDELTSEDIRGINSYDVPAIIVNHTVYGEKSGCIIFNHEELIRKICLDNIHHSSKTMTFLHVHNGGRLLKRVETAFISTLEAQNHQFEIKNCDDSYSSTYEEFKEYFKFNKSGYFIAYRDSIAAAITNAAIEAGLRVPEDVEVISIIGTRYSRILRPSISAMNVNFTDVGKRSVVMLNDLMNGSLTQKIAKFDVKIVKRQSTIE